MMSSRWIGCVEEALDGISSFDRSRLRERRMEDRRQKTEDLRSGTLLVRLMEELDGAPMFATRLNFYDQGKAGKQLRSIDK